MLFTEFYLLCYLSVDSNTVAEGSKFECTGDCFHSRGNRGQWVLDWEYANRTSYANHGGYSNWHFAAQRVRPTPGQPFRYATAWRWLDHSGCQVTEMNHRVFCEALQALGVTRILVVGDSLSMQFFQSLLSLLGFPPPAMGFNRRFRPFKIPCPNFELKVLMLRRSPLKDLLAMPKRQKDGSVLCKNFINGHKNKTAIVMNTGSWIKGMKGYTVGFRALLEWLDLMDSANVVAFYRPTIPGHSPCKPVGNQTQLELYNWTVPVWEAPFQNYAEYDSNRVPQFQWNDFEEYNRFAY